MRALFIGESWLGSSARSIREALSRTSGVAIDQLDEDYGFIRPRAAWLRAINRVITPALRQEFAAEVIQRIHEFQPDVVIVYKGFHIHAGLLGQIRRLGVATVNIYPDCSPHAHGSAHRRAVGEYDLVISSKPYHPAAWSNVYGYANRCVFVPQGYDPLLHLAETPPANPISDIVLVATWRHEYGQLMRVLAEGLRESPLTVTVGGHGWTANREHLPPQWRFVGGLQGRGYVELLRKGRICIAPLSREVIVNGERQPGDEDSTRTYELAAAWCFFIHRRTDYARTVFDESSEVPMFDSADELAQLITHYLDRPDERQRMAEAAHRRAVPAYSTDARAQQIVAHICKLPSLSKP